jgi:hypothetical protein
MRLITVCILTAVLLYILLCVYQHTGELVDGVSGGSHSGATAARAAVCAIAEQSPAAGDFVRRLVMYTHLICTAESSMHFAILNDADALQSVLYARYCCMRHLGGRLLLISVTVV